MKTINKLFGTPIEVVPCNCRVWILAVIKMNSKKKKKKTEPDLLEKSKMGFFGHF